MPAQELIEYDKIKGVHKIPLEELYTSGHRTCQGCESATTMRGFIKAAGSRSVVTGSTGCMYVANTSYMTTPWIVPWMHTQLGAGGSSAVGMAAGLRALMRKGKIAEEKINAIAFCGDLGGGDMGLSGISGALQTDFNLLIILYDNESYANTDIQASGSTPYGAVTTFSPSGKKHRITQTRWKKNTPGALVAGHPDAAYIATACASYGVDFMNKVRKGLASGGPSFIHVLDPCPKGWHYDPQLSHELGKLAIETGIWSLWEMEDHTVKLNATTRAIASGRARRKPVREYLAQQGRFAHFTEEDYEHFQRRVDEQWTNWLIPGVVSFGVEAGTPLNLSSSATAVPAKVEESAQG